eukprot:4467212-Prymnesium_polylepis.1
MLRVESRALAIGDERQIDRPDGNRQAVQLERGSRRCCAVATVLKPLGAGTSGGNGGTCGIGGARGGRRGDGGNRGGGLGGGSRGGVFGGTSGGASGGNRGGTTGGDGGVRGGDGGGGAFGGNGGGASGAKEMHSPHVCAPTRGAGAVSNASTHQRARQLRKRRSQLRRLHFAAWVICCAPAASSTGAVDPGRVVIAHSGAPSARLRTVAKLAVVGRVDGAARVVGSVPRAPIAPAVSPYLAICTQHMQWTRERRGQ